MNRVINPLINTLLGRGFKQVLIHITPSDELLTAVTSSGNTFTFAFSELIKASYPLPLNHEAVDYLAGFICAHSKVESAL